MNSHPPSTLLIVWRSASYYIKSHLAVALGVAAAVAVIVGALVVGDSVRGSLRNTVVERLANIECLLHSRTFFDPKSLPATAEGTQSKINGNLVPAILLQGASAEHRLDDAQAIGFLNASQVQLIGIDDGFLDALQDSERSAFPQALNEDEVCINAALADELNAKVGDEIALRFAKQSGVAGDNPLGRRDDALISLPRQKVVAILPNRGIGGLSTISSQSVTRNVFASLATMQDIIEVENQVNAAFTFSSSTDSDGELGQVWSDELNLNFRPKLEDYGLKLERNRLTFDDPADEEGGETKVIFDYYQLVSNDLVLDTPTSDAVLDEFGKGQAWPSLTYLANEIQKVEPTSMDFSLSTQIAMRERPQPRSRENAEALVATVSADFMFAPQVEPEKPKTLSRSVPYSLVVGIEEDSPLPLPEFEGEPKSRWPRPYCWVNSWLAKELDVSAGEWIDIKYFEPETTDGKTVTESFRCFVAGVVPLTEPSRKYIRNRPAVFSQEPTVFNDPGLTPSVPGVTDQDSISKWDLPFELDLNELILKQDDEYWNNHRLTPKVLMPQRYASSGRRFGSRFGTATAIRFATTPDQDVEGVVVDATSNLGKLRAQIESALLKTSAIKGLHFRPIRRQQLQAASGTTPFDMLFLSLSFFVIVSALLLVTLLFKLGIQQRTAQLGLLSAQGFSTSSIRRMLLGEYTIVALVGAVIGILLGLGYAQLMIAGLKSWWAGAVTNAFLQFQFQPLSLAIGAFSGIVASLVAVYFSLRKVTKATPLSMLRGVDTDQDSGISNSSNRFSYLIALVSIAVSLLLAFSALGKTGMERAGFFFGSGMLLLAAIWILLRQLMQVKSTGSKAGQVSNSTIKLAWQGICRNPVRSSLALGLFGVASFLIASMSVFQVAPSERGYGGFQLIGESSQPIFQSLASFSAIRDRAGDESKKLRDTTIVPARMRKGEDASCNNLFQVAQPTIIGMPNRLSQVFDFSADGPRFDWAATKNAERPWDTLRRPADGSVDDPIPVIIDQNTAAWSLKQGAALDAIVTLQYDNQTVYFKTVGLLSNSVLQGKLLISEANFERVFPSISGYRFFLIRMGSSADQQDVTEVLESSWSDEGMDVVSSEVILQQMLGVQNTYISAFQSLGALGLLLGTLGLIAVQLRSVLERRSELALMQAVGFSKQSISWLLVVETSLLLIGGVSAGVIAAAIAVVPYLIDVGPQLSLINPVLMLLVVLAAGLLAAVVAVTAAMRLPLISSLRTE